MWKNIFFQQSPAVDWKKKGKKKRQIKKMRRVKPRKAFSSTTKQNGEEENQNQSQHHATHLRWCWRIKNSNQNGRRLIFLLQLVIKEEYQTQVGYVNDHCYSLLSLWCCLLFLKCLCVVIVFWSFVCDRHSPRLNTKRSLIRLKKQSRFHHGVIQIPF